MIMRWLWCEFEGLPAVIEYDGELSATAYLILAVVLLGIIGGLGWCFYRALRAAAESSELQSPDEVGNGEQATKRSNGRT